MKELNGKTIVLTGATGGIGQQLARALATENARLILVGRDQVRLQKLLLELSSNSHHQHRFVVADLSTKQGLNSFKAACCDESVIDMLINNAGVNDFAFLEQQDIELIQKIVRVNLLVPILTCKILLPLLQTRPEAVILNVGSTLGSIGFPGNATYCASKFGLRGFTEALRRELSNTKVKVHYLSPRATRTAMNSSTVDALNNTLRNAVDDPQVVVAAALKLLRAKRSSDAFLGWPEKLFVKINSLFPKLVSQNIAKQLATIRQYAFHSHQH